ncbi:MAG TPA: hypothetical protein VGM98_14790 [Schlesneria sp.]
MVERRIEPEAVAAILEQLLPCLDPEKVISTFGDRTVIYSDETQSPALYVEIMLLEKKPKYIHLLASVYSSINDKRGCSSVILDCQQ